MASVARNSAVTTPEDEGAEDTAEELAYVLGAKAVWRSLLGQCLRELGVNDPDADRARWLAERRDAIATLRQWCGQYGDNDWSDHLHLSDVIERHLMRDVSEKLERPRTDTPSRPPA